MSGRDGHGEPCYYCGGKCNNLAGSPSKWAVPLSHPVEPGVVKWHHTGCVSERLMTLDKYRELWTRMNAVVDQHTKKGFRETADYHMVDFFLCFDDIKELERHIEIAEELLEKTS